MRLTLEKAFEDYIEEDPVSIDEHEIDIKKDIPDDVEDILAKLRQMCKEQRIRISEFFRDFDKLRSGSITEAQFRIGLNMGKIVLSGNEFRTLCNQF